MSRHRRQSLKRRRLTGPWSLGPLWPPPIEGHLSVKRRTLSDGTVNEPFVMVGMGVLNNWTCRCGKRHPPNRYRCKTCRQPSPLRKRRL